MLIIYLKIIYILFFSTKQNFVHDPLTTKQCRGFGFENMDDWLLLHHAPRSREKFLGLCTIYKQTKMHSVCIWYSCHACFESIVENLSVFGPEERVCGECTHTETCGKQAFMLRVSA